MNSYYHIINTIIHWSIKIFNFPAEVINYILICIYAIVTLIRSYDEFKELGIAGFAPIMTKKMQTFVKNLIESTTFPIPFIKDCPKVLYHHALMFWIILIWFLVK